MKKNSRLIKEFMALSKEKRNAFFTETSPSGVPSTETLGAFLQALPQDEAVRLVNEVKSYDMQTCLEHIFHLRNGKKYFIQTFPFILTERLSDILFDVARDFQKWTNLFDFLPISTSVNLVDCIVNPVLKGEYHASNLFRTRFLLSCTEKTAKSILCKIKPESFKALCIDSMDLGQDKFYTYAATFSPVRISKLCLAFPAKRACTILSRITEVKKQKLVLDLLPKEFNTAFFARKNNTTAVSESNIILTKLPISGKKQFVKQFPKSQQIKGLSFGERLECAV